MVTDASSKRRTIDWLHKTKEIDGVVSFTVEDKTLTEKQVVGELLKKMKAGLKAMHLWDDKLVGDYKEYVKEHNEYAEEQKESRSRSAKKAAETRKKKAPVKTATPAPKEKAFDKFKKAVEKATTRKVHAVDPNNKEFTRCMKPTDKYPTAEGDAVTCGLCQSSRDASARWEAYLQEHPEERGWRMWRDEYSWVNKDGRRMEKTKRKKEYTVSDENGVIGAADSYEAGCALKREHPAASALAAAEKANKRSKGTNATPAATPAKTEQVKMARIGNTNEFGVFSDPVGNARQPTR